MGDYKRVAVSGASGFIGSRLCAKLEQRGYEVCPMVRHKSDRPREIYYDYQNHEIDSAKLKDCHAVIHLAGKNLMAGLWTKKLKQEIYDSRVLSSRFISHQLSELEGGPQILLNASAVGIYGDRGEQKLDEESSPGSGFLDKVCIDWEKATLLAEKASIRVVNMRFGAVLDKDGGMLKAMLPIFKLGLGGRIGSGEQYISYVALEELLEQILFVLEDQAINGPVNMVSLEPVTNEKFTKELAKRLKRPAVLSVPKWVLKIFGEQSSMALASVRAYPKILLDHGYRFIFPHQIKKTLASALD